MSQIRDNVGASGANLPQPPTPEGDTQATADAAPHPSLTELQSSRRHERAEQEFEARQNNFQADFMKKLADPPGYGSNETEDSKGLKQAMTANGLPVPSAQTVQTVHAAVGQSAEFNDAVGQIKSTLQGDSPVPSPQQLNQMFTGILAQAPSLAKVGSAASAEGTGAAGPANDTAVSTQSFAAEGTTTVGAATRDVSLNSTVPTMSNYTAVVLLVTLAAQKENNKEKNDVLRQIKMYNGMLDALNTLVNDNLVTAQKQIEDKKNAGKDKKGFKPEDIQVAVNWPTSINTKSALMNSQTGAVVLDAQWGNSSSSSRRLVSSDTLGTLISQADQTRTSIQNNQQQQSNRFSSKDNLVSSLWNILNAVLKNTYEGTSSSTRNI